MARFENHASISNQADVQNIHGNVITNNFDLSHKRPRLGLHEHNPEEWLDDEILASLAFPQMFDRRNQVESPHHKTCQWLFDQEKFQAWEKEPRGLFWIKGKPGSGKSTLMSHLYRKLWLNRSVAYDVRLEFFFSARGTDLQHTPIGMMRSLLNQIFYQSRDTREFLRRSYLEKFRSFGNNSGFGWEWQLPELQRLFVDTVTACARNHQVIIFVDALDEAGAEAARSTARYLHEINDCVVESAGTAKICISCRHYPITSAVEILEVHMEHHNKDDISRYIEDTIQVREDMETPQLVQILIDKAQGVFQWVRLVGPMIEKWLDDGDSIEQILANLSTIPKDLEAVYEYILERVIDTRYRQKTLRLFQWVCLAARPLLVVELRYALSVQSVDRADNLAKCEEAHDFVKSGQTMCRRITAWSGGLVEIGPSEQNVSTRPRPAWTTLEDGATVQVIHQSVTDFMINRGLSLLMALDDRGPGTATTPLSSFHLHEILQMSHRVIYLSCLKYMCIEGSDNETLARYERHLPVDCLLDEAEVNMEFPLMKYAVQCTLYHAEYSGYRSSTDLEGEVQLLRDSCRMWTFAYKSEGKDEMALYIAYRHLYMRDGITALHLAAAGNLEQLVEYMVNRNANVDAVDLAGSSAMHMAAAQGHVKVVKILHKAGADLQRETAAGDTPLLLAVRSGNIDVFTYLLNHGVSIDATNKKSEGTLYTAAMYGNVSMCRACVAAGADVNARGGFYGNALQAAVDSDFGGGATVRFLLEAGANIHAEEGLYGNALQAAAFLGKETVTSMLLKAGADVNAEAGPYGNALHAAASMGNETVTSMLLKAGADVNAEGGVYGNALQAAVRDGSETVVEMLLEAGADVNAEGGFHGNALRAAVEQGSETVVKMLIEAGADVNAGHDGHGSALHIARYLKNVEIVNLLEAAGAKSVQ